MLKKVYDGFLNIAKRKSGKEGTSTANNTQIVRRSAEGAKQSFPK